MSSAAYIQKHFRVDFPMETSKKNPNCLEYRLPKNISRLEEQMTKVMTGKLRDNYIPSLGSILFWPFLQQCPSACKLLYVNDFSRTFPIRYSKTVLRGHSKRRPKMVFEFKTNYRLMQVKSIAECSKGSILQYLRLSLSYHLSLGSLFCLFLSGRLRQFTV